MALTLFGMAWDVMLAQFALALAFFLILSWLGAHSYGYGYKHLTLLYQRDEAPLFNLTFRIAAPLVYLVIVSAALYSLGLDRYVQNIFLVPIYYYFLRFALNVGLGHGRLLNWWRELFLVTLCIAISVYLYRTIIAKKTFLFPNATTIANEIWIGVIVFICSVGNKVTTSGAWPQERRRIYIRSAFARFHSRYDHIVSKATPNPHLRALIYAVMLFENFNRPAVVRCLERVILPFRGPRTIGVMQVRTDKNISDEESVRLGSAKVVADWNLALRKDWAKALAEYSGEKDLVRRQRCAKASLFRKVIASYNGGSPYNSEVGYLYEEIVKLYPEVRATMFETWRNA